MIESPTIVNRLVHVVILIAALALLILVLSVIVAFTPDSAMLNPVYQQF